MPEIVIRIEAPEGVSVRVEGSQVCASGCSETGCSGSARGGNGAHRGAGGAKGSGDGSASEKQRKLIFARCKAAGVELADALRVVGLTSLKALGWKDVEGILAHLEAGTIPPRGEADDDDPEIPF